MKTFDELSPKMPNDVQRIEHAMRNADEIHFNTEGFRVPGNRSVLKTEFGDPLRGYTNYEYGRVMQNYQGKTYFWRGDAPDYDANLVPFEF